MFFVRKSWVIFSLYILHKYNQTFLWEFLHFFQNMHSVSDQINLNFILSIILVQSAWTKYKNIFNIISTARSYLIVAVSSVCVTNFLNQRVFCWPHCCSMLAPSRACPKCGCTFSLLLKIMYPATLQFCLSCSGLGVVFCMYPQLMYSIILFFLYLTEEKRVHYIAEPFHFSVTHFTCLPLSILACDGKPRLWGRFTSWKSRGKFWVNND